MRVLGAVHVHAPRVVRDQRVRPPENVRAEVGQATCCVVTDAVVVRGSGLLVVNVKVTGEPTVPNTRRSVNVATPLDAVTVVVPTTLAPALAVTVTVVKLSVVTVAPATSRRATIGCVERNPPEAPATGAVVTTSDRTVWY